MQFHTTLTQHIQLRVDRFYKGTLFESEHMLVGIDCLAIGQSQAAHMHAGHDKMYYIQQGIGSFVVGSESFVAHVGDVVWAPADTLHAVTNTGNEPLIMLITMAPQPR